ncbi:50S ribosomal protein L10 [Candidatus Woesearchaeota archaeon]|nr:50S ribosomal protein L10 [Candidatus Woesearchaeota archaeon]
MAHVSQKKKQEYALLKEYFKTYPIIGIIDLTHLPSRHFQKIRAELRNTVLMRVTKKRLIKLILPQLKDSIKNIESLTSYLENSIPALLFTKEDPFKIAKKLAKTKSKAPAKPGQIAPFDIIIQKGPTKFPPGPIIGELGAAGIKAGIEEGKVAIKEDKLLVNKGEKITQKQADIMAKLGIEPMEIGLNVMAILQNGLLYDQDVLSIDEAKIIAEFKQANAYGIQLAVSIGYLTKETIKILLLKADAQGKSLGNKVNLPMEQLEASLAEVPTEEDRFNKLSTEAAALIDELKDKKIQKQMRGG